MIARDALDGRLQEIDEQIRRARKRLGLTESFHEGHVFAKGDLDLQYEFIRGMVDSEVENFEAKGMHINSLQKTILFWLNGIAYDR